MARLLLYDPEGWCYRWLLFCPMYFKPLVVQVRDIIEAKERAHGAKKLGHPYRWAVIPSEEHSLANELSALGINVFKLDFQLPIRKLRNEFLKFLRQALGRRRKHPRS